MWQDLGIPLDRAESVSAINDVRKTRNDVMHFDPDGIPDTSLHQLRNLVQVLDSIRPTMAQRARTNKVPEE